MAKQKRSVPKTVEMKDAKFLYVSLCCNEFATKPSLVMATQGIGGFGAAPETENIQGLGGWRCSKCKKATKVSRTVNQPQTETAPND
jgi:hypothetical protein